MRTLVLVVFACTVALLAPASRAADPLTLDVWPGGKAPGNAGPAVDEKWDGKKVTNVTRPTLTVFRPDKDKDVGAAVIVCPGGGYKSLMMDYEGEDVARWLTTLGVTGIVLKYRLPAPEGTPRWAPALQDAQRSVSLVRSKAAEWGIDPQRIGVLGFSAGGHLSAAVSTNFDKRTYDAVDDVDKSSCRPDFAVLVYPGGVLEKGADGKPTEKLSAEVRVTPQTPPAFIVMADNDPVNPVNAVTYYLALKHAGVPAELHVYSAGGHGFGIKKTDKPAATWPERCAEWMRGQGILKAKGGGAAS